MILLMDYRFSNDRVMQAMVVQLAGVVEQAKVFRLAWVVQQFEEVRLARLFRLSRVALQFKEVQLALVIMKDGMAASCSSSETTSS